MFSKTSWRRYEDILNITIFHLPRRLQDVLKTCLQDVFQILLQNVSKTSSRRLRKTSSWRLSRGLQDILEDKNMLHWRHLQDVINTSSTRIHQDEYFVGSIFSITLVKHYLEKTSQATKASKHFFDASL